ncbi:MAG: TonB-dependent receptor [Proteobacteria bacterium]|nr:TonB-dependent receptor [Pseudomonadota bacterium]
MTKRIVGRSPTRAGVGVIATCLSAGVAAQTAAEPDTVSEIVVTAQKRAERIQDIPISVSAISAQDMDRAGAGDFHDLLLSIPGVSFSSSEPGQSRYSIRGISTAASSPTVGIYLNDISLITVGTGFSGAADPALIDLERVEVLKGPQGTLYGGSAMGGAIKYVTREPVLDKFAVTAEGGVASVAHGGISYNAESFLNVPLLTNQLAIRLGGSYRYDAGYVDNVPGGQVEVWGHGANPAGQPFAPTTFASPSTFNSDDWNGRRTVTARASMKWTPTDSLTVLPVATLQRMNKANPDDYFTNLPDFQNSVRFNQPTHDDLDVYSLNVNQQWDAVTLTSLSGWVNRKVQWDRDYSLFIAGLVPPLLNDNSYNISDTSSRTFTQELRLASSDPHARLKWTVGLFYAHQRDELYQTVNTIGAGAFFGTGTDLTYSGDQLTHTIQKAAFADVTYSVLSSLDLSVGLRWFDINQKVDGLFDGIFNGGSSSVDGKKSTDVGVTPKYSVSYHVMDNSLLYGSATKGFRQGGPNRFNTDSPLCEPDFQRLGISRAPASFQPDSLWTYELGTKNEVGPRHTLIDAALYYTDWKKIQQQVNLNSCGFQFVGNVGAAKIKGAELSVESTVAEGLVLGGNASYIDSRITQTAPGVSAQVGQQVLDTPRWSASAHGEYRFLNRADWAATFRLDYQFHGSNLRAFEAEQTISYPDGSIGAIPDATQVQAAYHVVNAGLNVTNNNTEYRLYLDNLTDAAPYLDFTRSAGVSSATTIRPRTIGFNVRTTF